MRAFVLSEANSRQAYGRLTVVVRIIRNWRHRDDLKRLASMDDYMLADIGLSRDMVNYLRRLPLTADMDWERDRLARLQR